MEMIKLIRKRCNCSAKRKEKNKNISRYFGLVLSSTFEFFHNAEPLLDVEKVGKRLVVPSKLAMDVLLLVNTFIV